MAAFRASRFVWPAISEITRMISPIFSELVRMRLMASIDLCTAVAALLGQLAGVAGEAIGRRGVVLDGLDRVGEVLDGGGDLLDAGALVLGAQGQLLRTVGDDARHLVELRGALGHLADDLVGGFDGRVDGRGQPARLVVPAGRAGAGCNRRGRRLPSSPRRGPAGR